MLKKDSTINITPKQMNNYSMAVDKLEKVTNELLNTVDDDVELNVTDLVKMTKLYVKNKIVIDPVLQNEVFQTVAKIEKEVKTEVITAALESGTIEDVSTFVEEINNNLSLDIRTQINEIIEQVEDNTNTFTTIASSIISKEKIETIAEEITVTKIISKEVIEMTEILENLVTIENLEELNITCPNNQINIEGICHDKVVCAENEIYKTLTNQCIEPDPAPKISIDTPAQNIAVKEQVVISGACENAYIIRIFGDIEQSSITIACTNEAFSQIVVLSGDDGNKKITITQKDNVGNQAIDSRTITKDTKAPTVSITSPNSKDVVGTTFTIEGTCDANENDVELSGDLMNSPITISCNGTFSSLVNLIGADELKTLSMSQSDNLGNKTVVEIELFKDTSAPVLSNDVLTTSNVNITSLTLSWTKALDNVSLQSELRYQVYLSTSNNITSLTEIENNGSIVEAWSTDINTINITELLPETTYYFNVVVKDKIGSKITFSTISQTTLSLDTTPPPVPNAISLSDPTVSPYNDTTPTLQIEGVYTGDTIILFSDHCITQVASGVANATTINLTSSALIDDTYHFYVKAQDPIGNISDCSTATIEYVLNTSTPDAPTITLLSPSSTLGNNTTPTYRISGVANGYTVELYKSTGSGCDTFLKQKIASDTIVDITTETLTADSYTMFAKVANNGAGTPSSCSSVGASYILNLTPPNFAGISSISIVDSQNITINWNVASDDSTSQANMAYEIYKANGSAIEDFNFNDPIKSVTGVTQTTISDLSVYNYIWFIVRAMDENGNLEDNSNIVEYAPCLSPGIDANTVLLLHSNDDPGNPVIDATSRHTFTSYGSVDHNTTDPKFDASSLLFDGTDDYIDTADNMDDFNFGSTMDFTIDFWFKTSVNSGRQMLVGDNFTSGGANSNGWMIYLSSGRPAVMLGIPGTNGTSISANDATWADGAWHHFALIREDQTMYMYLDGVRQTNTIGYARWHPYGYLYLGRFGSYWSSSWGYLSGNLDEIRVSRNVARWTGTSFTPPPKRYCN